MDETTDANLAQYDMIIGADLMTELGIDLLYSDQLMVWENNEVPIKPHGFVATETQQYIYHMQVEDSPIIQKAEQRRMQIFDADYSKVDLVSFTDELKHLSAQEKSTLY